MRIDNVLGDSIGFVELVDHMGGDAQVVNSARVSYGKQVDILSDKDIRLIRRLITDKHVSVLRSTVFTFRVACPMVIRNQWYRHVIGGAYANDQIGWNEISRRYTSQEIEFYVPQEFRGQDPNNKQASIQKSSQYNRGELRDVAICNNLNAHRLYRELLEAGVCREQARLVLPQSLYTEFLWTASLQAVLHFLELRAAPDSQWEIQQYAQAIHQLSVTVVPVTIDLWLENQKEGSNGLQ